MNSLSIEISPELIKRNEKTWKLDIPMAQTGGAMFAITADWCSHCKELKKTVSEAQRNKPFDFFYMTADKTKNHSNKVNEMGVEGFPTTYFVGRGGNLYTYEGERSIRAFNELFTSKP